MAKTGGHGNPPWTRDEVLLALNLFFDAGMVALNDSHPKVIALSETLRTLPGNEDRSGNESFRNPAGVAFKLLNLQSIAGGKGLSNVSAVDTFIWSKFGSRRNRVKEISNLILEMAKQSPLDAEDDAGEVVFAEGSVITGMHRRIERNRRLRSSLIKERRKNGPLRCDACQCGNPTQDPKLDEAIFDAHHLTPLSSQMTSKTKLSETALLCANCHRLIHRLIAISGRWATVEDVRIVLGRHPEQPE